MHTFSVFIRNLLVAFLLVFVISGEATADAREDMVKATEEGNGERPRGPRGQFVDVSPPRTVGAPPEDVPDELVAAFDHVGNIAVNPG